MPTARDIIKKFEAYVDDTTELSTASELDLLNKIYRQVWTDRPWEFAKKEFSGLISGTEIDLPSDFSYIYSKDPQNNDELVYVDDKPVMLVGWSDRKQYEGKIGYCWVDIPNNKLCFSTPQNGTVKYDYIFFPPDLGLDDTPLFPAAFHDVLYHGMASEDYIIQQFDKAKSYSAENMALYNQWLTKMALWNANLSYH